VFLLIYSYFVFYNPNLFIQAENYVPANRLKTPAHIVPEWYFLPFYAILRSIPDLLGGVIAMSVSVLIFAAMPFLDRSNIPGGAKYRPFYRIAFYIFIINVVVLGYVGASSPEGWIVPLGQVATFIYFAIFALLPFGSKMEERWLRKRGLPAAVEALIKCEQIRAEKCKKGDCDEN